MKTSTIYFTESGNTAKAAEIIKDGMMKVEGTEARLFGLYGIDEEYVAASDAVLFGAPTYYVGAARQLVKFFHETGYPLPANWAPLSPQQAVSRVAVKWFSAI